MRTLLTILIRVQQTYTEAPDEHSLVHYVTMIHVPISL